MKFVKCSHFALNLTDEEELNKQMALFHKNEGIKLIIYNPYLKAVVYKIINNCDICIADKRNFHEGILLDEMIKLNIIKSQIEAFRQNIASVKSGILNPNVLTNEEMRHHDIDFNKLTNIRLGVAKFINESIIFTI